MENAETPFGDDQHKFLDASHYCNQNDTIVRIREQRHFCANMNMMMAVRRIVLAKKGSGTGSIELNAAQNGVSLCVSKILHLSLTISLSVQWC